MESARLAHRNDVGRLAELWVHATREIGGQRGGNLLIGSVAPSGPVGSGLAATLKDARRALTVGLIDDAIVGFGYGKLDEVPSLSGKVDRVGVVQVLFVEPEARGVGVGEAMMGVLLDHFGALGCIGVDAFALPGNREAKAFFETHGFVARMLVMHRPGGSKG